jgi:hypothetical protein
MKTLIDVKFQPGGPCPKVYRLKILADLFFRQWNLSSMKGHR